MSQRLWAEGVPMHEFRAMIQNFSAAIIELDAALVREGCGTMATPSSRAVPQQCRRETRSARQSISDEE
jgi:hypothetical protein